MWPQSKSSFKGGENEAIIKTQGWLTGKYNSSSSGDLRFLMDVIWMPCVFWRKAGGGKMQTSSWEHFWSKDTFSKQTVAPAIPAQLDFLVLSTHLIGDYCVYVKCKPNNNEVGDRWGRTSERKNFGIWGNGLWLTSCCRNSCVLLACVCEQLLQKGR